MACTSGCCGPKRPQTPAARDVPPNVTTAVGGTDAKAVLLDSDVCGSGECEPGANDGPRGPACEDACCEPPKEQSSHSSFPKSGENNCCSSSLMSKEDTCCSPSAKPLENDGCSSSPMVETEISHSTSVKEVTVAAPCCSLTTEIERTDCCAPSLKTAEDVCYSSSENMEEKACCASPSLSASCSLPTTKPYEQTGSLSPAVEKKGCCSPATKIDQDACCSSEPALAENGLPAPECCKGKTSPCCDTSCIDRLALRECQESHCTEFQDDALDENQGHPLPCQRHSRGSYSRYKARLDAIGCICRALIALGEKSCCSGKDVLVERRTRYRSSAGTKSPSTSVSSSIRRQSVAKHYTSVKELDTKTGGDARACCKASSLPKHVKKGCPTDNEAQGTGCCENVSKSVTPNADDCTEGCCGDGGSGIIQTPKVDAGAILSSDPESSLSGNEHVVLAISGMTCTGCETKLQRTLASLQPVMNLKTSLVLSRAEFDITLTSMTPEYVIKHLERTTEFKCERITSSGSSLDLICSGETSSFIESKWPTGVTGIKAVDRATIRVEFDAKVVGARDLAEKGWNEPTRLAPPKPDQSLDAGARHVRNVGLSTLLSVFLTIPVLVMAWAPLPKREVAYGSASLALATAIQVVIAGPFYPKALKAMIFSRVIEMDLLIVLSTSAAYIFSVVAFAHLVAGQPLSTGEFFETSTLLITLIMVGRYVAALARQKAVESTSVRALQVSTVTLCEDDGSTREIDTRLLQFGDIFQVAPDSVVPTDGTVLAGVSEVDESMMTGEAVPVKKETASVVIAGSVNGSGLLRVRLTQLPDSNTISTIASMIDEAKLSKPKIQETADRVASYFVPVVVALTVVTFCIWVAVGVVVQGKTGSEAVTQAITYGITVLIVSCPCAIGLAVPIVIVMAAGIAAERGVIFKSAEAIELGCKTKHVVFDKTGTLTEGKLRVVQEDFSGSDVSSTKSMLLALVEGTKHPVSMAIARHLQAGNTSPDSDIMNPAAVVGKGVQATYRGMTVRAGNSRWLGLSSNERVVAMLNRGYTVVCFLVQDDIRAIIGLKDKLRSDSAEVVSSLHAMRITVHIVSGDDDGAVREVARDLEIPNEFVRSRCSPADKRDYVRIIGDDSVSSGEPQPVTMFCGDGTNDAPALAQATIGVHVNEGTDIAKSAADVVLTRPHLSGILVAISVSKKSIHRIAFNFGWSFVYNLFAVLLAAGAFVNARIPPAYAGLGELVSVLPVILAGFLLRYARI